MLDRRLIRENPKRVIAGIKAKQADVDIDRLISLDKRLLDSMKEAEKLKHERNVKTEEVAGKKRADEDTTELHAYLKNLSQEIKRSETQDKEITAELDELLLVVPNLPHESVPLGKGTEDNVVVRTVGEKNSGYDDPFGIFAD